MKKSKEEKIAELSFACDRCGWWQSITKEEERLFEHITELRCTKCNHRHRDIDDIKDFSYATRETL